ncbi:hypothetical protein BMETH_2284_0 [methanotrophic bacterial endosymbiont of Bathymodiolus sp.]|nr:hypothetical protein BMETH_2284_0 [methanotrophic bacterial endosymbiont of Bathymodiolus sp.]
MILPSAAATSRLLRPSAVSFSSSCNCCTACSTRVSTPILRALIAST